MTQRREATVDALPLPALDVPLRLVVPELEARAARGDALAACRIAAEYEWCDALRSHRAQLQDRIARLQRDMPSEAGARVDSERRIEATKDISASVDKDYARHCGGAPVLGAAQRAGYWRQAALQGHLPALRHYAIGNAFRFHDMLDALPALERYRREAESMALRAANAGDAAMMYALAMAYAEGSDNRYRPFLAQALQPDAAKALVWFRRLDAISDQQAISKKHPVRRDIDEHLATLSLLVAPDELARAETATAGYRPAVGVQLDDLLAVANANGGLADVDRTACGRREFAPHRG